MTHDVARRQTLSDLLRRSARRHQNLAVIEQQRLRAVAVDSPATDRRCSGTFSPERSMHGSNATETRSCIRVNL